MLLLDWPTFCSIGHSWPNCCLVKFFLQSCWYMPITKHSRSKSPLQPSYSCPMFHNFFNLSTLTNYRAKVSRIYLLYLLSFNSQSSFSYLYIPIEVALHMFHLYVICFKAMDYKATHHLLSLAFTPFLNSSTNIISFAPIH